MLESEKGRCLFTLVNSLPSSVVCFANSLDPDQARQNVALWHVKIILTFYLLVRSADNVLQTVRTQIRPDKTQIVFLKEFIKMVDFENY